ncbi:MAG: MraY family glycosyltransferase [Candidatus Omnitrophica bacterium]|nr:MraY family glycosyltransferase [Candidatus Omnitrophota bacterium]
MFIDSLLLAGISFSLSLFFMLLFKIFSLKHRVLLRQNIPQVGGIAISLSFIVSVLTGFFCRGLLPRQALGIILASLAILVFGIIDDWRESSIRDKFFFQLIATSILYYFGIKTQIVYIGPFLNAVITFIWVIGVTNAFNHLDVMDGIAAGNAIIATCAFLSIAFLNNDLLSSVFTLSLFGATCGFIIFNLPPARVYLGNSGSHLLGFILAALSMVISYAPMEKKIALLSPLLILGFPIFDTLFLILVRLSRNRMPFQKSNDHLVLRFLAIGVSKRSVLFFIFVVAGIFSLCGVFLTRFSNYNGAFLVLGAVLVSFVIAKAGWKINVND